MNRLDLNFQLPTREERTEYARIYLDNIRFKPTNDELDTIAKYILWGKDSKTGLNGRQEGIELETRYRTWDTQNVESLDALIESPTFTESMLRRPTDPPTRIPREIFSRDLARKKAPPDILAALESLWREIDSTELLLNFYELNHAKRKNPPRDTLIARFTQPEIKAIKARSTSLTPYSYLKLRHQLVDLRREQYVLKDEYSAPILAQNTFQYHPEDSPIFGADVPILPFGLPNSTPLSQKLFNPARYPIPQDFSEAELKELSTLLWTPKTAAGIYFDFSDPDHLYKLFEVWDLLRADATQVAAESTLPFFLKAAETYHSLAELDPLLEEIFQLKIAHHLNQDIADYINKKYHKSYQPNYISTLYCKKCLGGIASAAKRHREVLENLFFPENFKVCKDCGRTLLIDEENFVRRHRSKDGFSTRCKKCEKIRRNKQ